MVFKKCQVLIISFGNYKEFYGTSLLRCHSPRKRFDFCFNSDGTHFENVYRYYKIANIWHFVINIY